VEAAEDRADLGTSSVTQFVLIGLGVLIAVLTVVAVFDLLPPLRIVPTIRISISRVSPHQLSDLGGAFDSGDRAVLHPRAEFRHRLQGRHAAGGAEPSPVPPTSARCARH
jgi:hypothetical protein